MNFIKELSWLCVMLMASVFLVYYVPVGLTRVLFLPFLFLFYQSKRNYLWIAFIFVLIEQPGGLFSGGLVDDTTRLPIYNIMPGFSFTFVQFFIMTALFKAWNMRTAFKPAPFLRKGLKSLALYFLMLLPITIALGLSMDVFRNLYKVIVNLTLYYSMYFLIRKEQDFVNFFRLIFPFAFAALFLQLYSLVVGHQLVTIFVPDITSIQGVLYGEIKRPIEMSTILIMAFYSSMYFVVAKKSLINRNYALVVNIVSYFSIIITASRSWVIAFTVSYVLTIIIFHKQLSRQLIKTFVVTSLAVILLFSSAVFSNQYYSALKRISTIELLVKGDVTAGSTAKRYDIRAPRVLEGFKESSIFLGAGFSNHYLQYQDGHVGFHNLLLNAGIVGVIVFGLFFFRILRTTFVLDRRLSSDNPYKNSLKIFPIVIIGMLLLNTGIQVIGYDIYLKHTLFFCIMLFFLNNQIASAFSNQESIDNL